MAKVLCAMLLTAFFTIGITPHAHATTFYSGDISGYSEDYGDTMFFNGDVEFMAKSYDKSTFFTGDLSGMSKTLGNSTFYNVNDMNYYTNKIGDSLFYDGDVTGYAEKIGDSTYYNLNVEGAPVTYRSKTFVDYSIYNYEPVLNYTPKHTTTEYKSSYSYDQTPVSELRAKSADLMEWLKVNDPAEYEHGQQMLQELQEYEDVINALEEGD